MAAHWRYKESKTASDKDLEEWANWIRDIFENASGEEARENLLESFKLNLYQDEIYAFTPKGDLRRLPIDSTTVDFAFDIHSKVGYHCIGAKINGRIVPLDTSLNSGDQIEIITSKNQQPNKNWLKFVKTHKAKSNIRRYINKEEQKIVDAGKEIWDKKIKKLKISYSPDELSKLVYRLKYDNHKQFYSAIVKGDLNLDEVLLPKKEEELKEQDLTMEFEHFADIARKDAGGVLVDGQKTDMLYSYAKCCKPIPGDPVMGYITVGEGVVPRPQTDRPRTSCRHRLAGSWFLQAI